MADVRELIISIVMIGLFVFAIITFGSHFSMDNDTNVSLLNDDAINRSYDTIEGQLEGIQSTADAQKDSFLSGIPVIEEVGIVIGAIVGVGTSIFNGFLRTIYETTITLISKTLGINSPVLLGTFTGLMVLTTVFLLWRVYRAGS